MVAVLTEEKVAQFEDLFADPSIRKMLDLEWRDFEGFVEYVFTCAGYAVENVSEQHFPDGPGVDLNLYTDHVGGMLAARVEVRRYTPPKKIDTAEAHQFWSKLHIAGAIPGYLVTTSDFAPGAQAVAAAAAVGGRVRLVNGQRLIRYIDYIRGSRVNEGPRRPTTPAPTPPDYLFQADTVARRAPTETVVLAVGNNRGGVAKTTTALNLALVLAEHKWRVLLADLDPQASLSRGLPPPEGEETVGSLVDYFVRGKPLPPLVRRTRFTHISLLPSAPDLRMADLGGGAHPDQELAFVAALHAPEVRTPDGEKFDWIILDTPPGQSFYTRSALAAAHYVLVPAAFDTWAALGMNGLLDTAKAMRGLMGAGVEIIGCLLTRFRSSAVRQNDMKAFEFDLAGRGITLFDARIRHDDRIEARNREATRGRLAGVLNFPAITGTGATDYQAALKELMRHVHHG